MHRLVVKNDDGLSNMDWIFKVSLKNMNLPRGDGFWETKIQAEVGCYGP